MTIKTCICPHVGPLACIKGVLYIREANGQTTYAMERCDCKCHIKEKK